MKESHPFNNKNFYGATKIASEAICRAYYNQFGLDYVGLRYMNVYGPNQDQKAAYSGVIPTVLNKIDANEEPQVNGDGSQCYDFIYVDDVARSNLLSLESNVTDEFYNVGSGIKTSIKDLCSILLELKNSKLNINYIPYSADDARSLVQNRIGCTNKSEKEINFKCETALKDGLKKLIKWRLENK